MFVIGLSNIQNDAERVLFFVVLTLLAILWMLLTPLLNDFARYQARKQHQRRVAERRERLAAHEQAKRDGQEKP